METNISTVSLKELSGREANVFHYIASDNNEALYQKAAHRRNDHFLFIFQKNGQSKIFVDFKEVDLTENSLICILPGQVHYTASVESKTEAWLLAVDIKLLHEKQRNLFEETYFNYHPITVEKEMSLFINECFKLFDSSQKLQVATDVRNSLVNLCVTAFVQVYEQKEPEQNVFLRKQIITKQFKNLLFKDFKKHKSTAYFAGKLHITPSYLSETVKVTTGFTVGYWIQQMVMTEAKRLLYATGKTVKEIAHELGFDDPAYFNRYFSKAENISPLEFRKRYSK
jgi:AraC-like DNA-binding protein